MPDLSRNFEFVNPDGLYHPNGYTHVVAAAPGTTIYVSGQVPVDAAGNLVGPGDMRAQAQQVFVNLKTALAALDADLTDVVKMTYFIVDMSQLNVVREVRAQFLDANTPPASTAVQVSGLFRPDVLIEIEAIAVLGD